MNDKLTRPATDAELARLKGWYLWAYQNHLPLALWKQDDAISRLPADPTVTGYILLQLPESPTLDS
jgi:hypothetical protein